MKCFHFTSADKEPAVSGACSGGSGDGSASRPPRAVSWARSLSFASSAAPSEMDGDRPLDDFYFSRQQWQDGGLQGLRVFGFAELKAATRGFSPAMLIGEGGFGSVYRGMVAASPEEGGEAMVDVAVKQLNRNGMQGHKEWITEVVFLGVLKHPNLVKLIGYCAEDDERGIQRLLVYELMPNKSLEDHLLSRASPPLSWPLRLRIAQDAAKGLAYLHQGMDFQLIFRDFKAANILLDENFSAKLSDFGLAREGPAEGYKYCHISAPVVGTLGYAAPEYIQSGKLTAKSDVWSFGVVLYELITGRRCIDRNLPKNEQKLLEWVKPYSSDHKKLDVIVDSRLDGRYCLGSVQKLITLANKCLSKQAKSRPKMSEVVEELHCIIAMSEESSEAAFGALSTKEGESDSSLYEGSSFRKRAFDIKDFMNLRNRSVGRMDWRILTPGVARSWI